MQASGKIEIMALLLEMKNIVKEFPGARALDGVTLDLQAGENDLNLPINPRTKVGNLGIGQQQLVEIAKALSQEARILVLDEPTAALTESEVETLFGILEKFKKRGVDLFKIPYSLLFRNLAH